MKESIRSKKIETQPPMATLIDRLDAAATRRERARARSPETSLAAAELTAALAALRADHLSGDGAVPGHPLQSIADVFGLDSIDTALLWLAAVTDLDANVGIAYARLRGLPSTARPTVALGLELTGVPTASPAGFARLGPGGLLRRHRLLDVPGAEPWVERVLRVPDPVVAVLAGAPAADPDVARLRTEAVPMQLAGSDVVARAIERGAGFIWIRSVHGAAGVSLAAGALAVLGLGTLAIDLRHHLAGQNLAETVAAAAREAGLHGQALLVAGADALAEGNDRAAFEILEAAVVPVVAIASRNWNPGWLPHMPLLIEADRLTVAQRAQTWRSNLGELSETDEQLRQTLLGLRMTPESVIEATRYARILAEANDQPISASIVRESARRISGAGSASADGVATASAGATRLSFADLMLPVGAADSLRQLVNWARHRDEVPARGTLRRSSRGIAALFAGNPGTGKTLAANVVADELSLDLLQVELSAIVDKYIGETEKNLEKVFQAAEALDVVLFFDEADALFGARSEVHDARDRYANQEIAYLLQRMESFDGITILATNLRGNLDRAFSRRMSFVIHFPDPDAPIRRRLWVHHLDQLEQLDATDPVHVDFLADAVELTGGDIRNIVLAAAYDAVSLGERVGMRHISEATVREYRKLGRVVPEHRFVRNNRAATSTRGDR